MIYELRKNHQGAQKIFEVFDKPMFGDAVLLGEDSPESFPYLLARVEAPFWLEAKRLFALPLTETQAKIANGTITHFELFGRWAGSDLEALKSPRSKP